MKPFPALLLQPFVPPLEVKEAQLTVRCWALLNHRLFFSHFHASRTLFIWQALSFVYLEVCLYYLVPNLMTGESQVWVVILSYTVL